MKCTYSNISVKCSYRNISVKCSYRNSSLKCSYLNTPVKCSYRNISIKCSYLNISVKCSYRNISVKCSYRNISVNFSYSNISVIWSNSNNCRSLLQGWISVPEAVAVRHLQHLHPSLQPCCVGHLPRHYCCLLLRATRGSENRRIHRWLSSNSTAVCQWLRPHCHRHCLPRRSVLHSLLPFLWGGFAIMTLLLMLRCV